MVALIGLLAIATVGSLIWCIATVVVRAPAESASDRFALAVVVLAVAGGALLRTLWLPAHHAMYVDEPWYAEAACNLARTGQAVLCETTWAGARCKPYAKAPGWPILLAPFVRVLGCQTWIGIAVSRLLGALAVLLIALAVRIAGGRWWPAAVAAVLLAVLPVHATWSVTAETNVAAATVFLAGLCGALLFLCRGAWSGAVLAAAAFSLATAIRTECAAPALVLAVVVAAAGAAPVAARGLAAAAIVLTCGVTLAAGAALWEMNTAISGGAFLSPANLWPHAIELLRQSAAMYGVLALSALAGALLLLRNTQWSSVLLFGGVALAGALAVLAYDRFHERMLLVAVMGLLPLAAFALAGVRAAQSAPARLARVAGAIVLAVIAGVWLQRLATAQPSETQLLETRIASRIGASALAGDALVIAAQPTVLAAAGAPHVMATETALGERRRLDEAIASGRPVFFLCDMFCEPGFQGGGGSAACDELLTTYALEPVITEVLHGRSYGLYRIAGRRTADTPHPACPRLRRG